MRPDIADEHLTVDPEGKLAQWAALFVKACANDDAATSSAAPPEPAGARYSGVTESACELLRAVDSGGVPAFITGNLKQIAEDNGVELSAGSTPNEIVEALRIKACASAAESDGEPG